MTDQGFLGTIAWVAAVRTNKCMGCSTY